MLGGGPDVMELPKRQKNKFAHHMSSSNSNSTPTNAGDSVDESIETPPDFFGHDRPPKKAAKWTRILKYWLVKHKISINQWVISALPIDHQTKKSLKHTPQQVQQPQTVQHYKGNSLKSTIHLLLASSAPNKGSHWMTPVSVSLASINRAANAKLQLRCFHFRWRREPANAAGSKQIHRLHWT